MGGTPFRIPERWLDMETSPEAELASRIARQGKITFAEYMEVALYHPVGGYYTRSGSVGASGDFYTSPVSHPAYGALLTVQLRRMWELLGAPRRFYAVELGAGSGALARDVLRYSSSLPGAFNDALLYVALDRRQARRGPANGPGQLQRLISQRVPFRGVVGCLLSNELVDSFPVHRFQIVDGEVAEVYVRMEGGGLVESVERPATPEVARRIHDLGESLPEGSRGEVSLCVSPWIRDVASSLDRGFVLTIDYGDTAGRLYSHERAGGTLRTHYRHTSGGGVYERVGRQDITAHADFSMIVSEGEKAGLSPVWMGTQAQYLTGLGLDGLIRRFRRERLAQPARDANMMGLLELVKEEGLGGFKVLVQEKSTGVTGPGDLSPSRPDDARPHADWELPLPLLGPDHTPLMAGRYPHAQWQPEAPWPGMGDGAA